MHLESVGTGVSERWRQVKSLNYLPAVLARAEAKVHRTSLDGVHFHEVGAIDAIVGAYHGDPFGLLGMHQVGDHLVVRVFRPEARAISVQDVREGGQRYPGVQVHGDGFFEVIIEGTPERFPYEIHYTSHDGHEWHERDPYSFGQIMGEVG